MTGFMHKKIKPQKSLGDILRAARQKKEINLDQAEEETKVRVKYLRALEEGRYEALPGNVYALGFLNQYLDFLELDKAELTRRFKTERGEAVVHGRLIPRRRMREPWFFLSQKMMIGLAVGLVILVFLGYIIYNVRAITMAPNLIIASPSSEQVLKTDTVNIIGKTDPGVTLLINNQTISLDGNGNFNQDVKLNPGLNTFEIRALSQLQKETVKQIKILAQF